MCIRDRFINKEEGIKQFGPVFKEAMRTAYIDEEYDTTPKEDDRYTSRTNKTLPIWEIRDVRTKKTLWICKSYEQAPLKEQEDVLQLEEYFPCPKPAYGTLKNDSLIPIPDYKQIHTLTREVDVLTRRINTLARLIRYFGIIDGSRPDRPNTCLLYTSPSPRDS